MVAAAAASAAADNECRANGSHSSASDDCIFLEVLHHREVAMVSGSEKTLEPPPAFFEDMERLLRHHPDNPHQRLAKAQLRPVDSSIS
jgi:hypothetical protein